MAAEAAATSRGRYLRWRLSKARRRLVRLVAARLYRDRGGGSRDTILVAGTGRSGTTWVGDLVASRLRARILFEPFHPRQVPDFRGFSYFQYMDPVQQSDALLHYCRRVFSGQIRHRWIDRQVEVLRPRCRLVKAIRANLFLAWIHRRFPEIPIILVVRHPCAVVLSRLRLGWDTDRDIEPCLSQPRLVEDLLLDKMDLIRAARSEEEKHAVIWCLHYLVPLRQMSSSDRTLVFYENLCLEPEREIARISSAIGRPLGAAALAEHGIPSTTATRRSAILAGGDLVQRWRQELTARQIESITAVVRGFQLDFLYGDSGVPAVESTFEPGEFLPSRVAGRVSETGSE